MTQNSAQSLHLSVGTTDGLNVTPRLTADTAPNLFSLKTMALVFASLTSLIAILSLAQDVAWSRSPELTPMASMADPVAEDKLTQQYSVDNPVDEATKGRRVTRLRGRRIIGRPRVQHSPYRVPQPYRAPRPYVRHPYISPYHHFPRSHRRPRVYRAPSPHRLSDQHYGVPNPYYHRRRIHRSDHFYFDIHHDVYD